MKPKSEQSSSAWMSNSAVPEMLPMMRDAQADVCIVGAGIAGSRRPICSPAREKASSFWTTDRLAEGKRSARALICPTRSTIASRNSKKSTEPRAEDDFDFAERLEELNEELEVLNSEARELEDRITASRG